MVEKSYDCNACNAHLTYKVGMDERDPQSCFHCGESGSLQRVYEAPHVISARDVLHPDLVVITEGELRGPDGKKISDGTFIHLVRSDV